LRLIGGDRDLLADHGVEQRGLSGVRAADETGEASAVGVVLAGFTTPGCPLMVVDHPVARGAPPGQVLGRRHTWVRDRTLPSAAARMITGVPRSAAAADEDGSRDCEAPTTAA